MPLWWNWPKPLLTYYCWPRGATGHRLASELAAAGILCLAAAAARLEGSKAFARDSATVTIFRSQNGITTETEAAMAFAAELMAIAFRQWAGAGKA